MAMAVDPTDPNIVYVGGTADGNQTGLIRINLTDIWDAHALVAYSYDANDGGQLTLASTGPATIASNLKDPVISSGRSVPELHPQPGSPFVANADPGRLQLRPVHQQRRRGRVDPVRRRAGPITTGSSR